MFKLEIPVYVIKVVVDFFQEIPAVRALCGDVIHEDFVCGTGEDVILREFLNGYITAYVEGIFRAFMQKYGPCDRGSVETENSQLRVVVDLYW